MKHLKTLPVKGTDTAALFGTEKIGKILFKIAPPVMLAQLILALYNVVDSYFVGKYSPDGLTALSVIFPMRQSPYLACIIKCRRSFLSLFWGSRPALYRS